MTKSPLILTTALLLAAAAPSTAQDQTAYGYVRTLEGSAVLARADTGEAVDLLPNYPLEVGDVVSTDPLTRIELVLPDVTIVRLAEDTRVELAQLAFSADSDDRSTVLVLDRGELQLDVTEYSLGDQLPTIHAPNATVYVLEPGSYRVGASPLGETRLVVRQGYAEVATARGSAIARSNEEVLVEGGDWPVVSVLEASYPDALELWGDELNRQVAAADYVDDVDPALGYSTATLAGHGEWVAIEGERAWRPAVEVSWRPFTRGTWVHSRIGLTWVSYEPWGWVTAHYGYWSLDPGWGWVWYPGYVYSPAWVYWYWGPEWAGWIPAGYYGAPYYSPFYGYAGGSWGYYSHWTFCPTAYVVHPHGPRHYYPGREMAGRTGRTAVPRGVITTQTGGIDRAVWRDGEQVAEVLERRARDSRGALPPDVTDFIAGRGTGPRDALPRGDGERAGTTVRRDVVTDTRSGRSRTDEASSARRPDASDRIVSQGWRDRGDDRSVVIRPGGDAARSRGSDVAPDYRGRVDTSRDESVSRLRQAWRSRYESSDRYRIWQGHSSETGYRGDPRGSGATDRGGSPDALPPARRVIDGIRTRPEGDAGHDDGSASRPDADRSHRSAPPTTRRDSSSGRSSDSGRRSTSSRDRDSGSRSRDHGGSARSRKDGGGSHSGGSSRRRSDHGG